MSTTSMAIFSNPLFETYSVYARNASFYGWLYVFIDSRMYDSLEILYANRN